MPLQFDPWELLGKAWLVVAGLFAWFAKRHLDEDHAVSTRVAVIEQNYATRADIAGLHTKIDTNHRQVIDLLSRR